MGLFRKAPKDQQKAFFEGFDAGAETWWLWRKLSRDNDFRSGAMIGGTWASLCGCESVNEVNSAEPWFINAITHLNLKYQLDLSPARSDYIWDKGNIGITSYFDNVRYMRDFLRMQFELRSLALSPA